MAFFKIINIIFFLLWGCASPHTIENIEEISDVVEQTKSPLKSEKPSPEWVFGVLDFQNNSPHKNWDYMQKAIPEIISSEISHWSNAKVVERGQISRIIDELELFSAGFIKPDELEKFGKFTGANTLIFGSITDLGGTIIVSAKVVEVETGEIITGATARGEEEKDLDILIKQLVQELKEHLFPE